MKIQVCVMKSSYVQKVSCILCCHVPILLSFCFPSSLLHPGFPCLAIPYLDLYRQWPPPHWMLSQTVAHESRSRTIPSAGVCKWRNNNIRTGTWPYVYVKKSENAAQFKERVLVSIGLSSMLISKRWSLVDTGAVAMATCHRDDVLDVRQRGS